MFPKLVRGQNLRPKRGSSHEIIVPHTVRTAVRNVAEWAVAGGLQSTFAGSENEGAIFDRNQLPSAGPLSALTARPHR